MNKFILFALVTCVAVDGLKNLTQEEKDAKIAARWESLSKEDKVCVFHKMTERKEKHGDHHEHHEHHDHHHHEENKNGGKPKSGKKEGKTQSKPNNKNHENKKNKKTTNKEQQ